MSNFLQKKLYEMEVDPPDEVWNRLSASLDEINADNSLAKKLRDAEAEPAQAIWEKIKTSLDADLPYVPSGGGAVVLLKRLAVAAVVIGVILSTYFIFFNSRQKNTEIVVTPALPVSGKTKKIQQEPGDITKQSVLAKEEPRIISADNNTLPAVRTAARSKKAKRLAEPVNVVFSQNELAETDKIGKKIFNQPIDDLSMIAANDSYYTMVNANGRMVKIPARLTNIAPYLQDKPVVQDYFELMFGEGAYWKEKLKDWRRKVAGSSQTFSAGGFFDVVDLLKSIQDN